MNKSHSLHSTSILCEKKSYTNAQLVLNFVSRCANSLSTTKANNTAYKDLKSK